MSFYRLDEEPWLPVQWSAAALARDPHSPPLVGLRTLLTRAHEISALAITEPPAHAAVLRVLYALTARVCALDEDGSEADWSERRLDVLAAGRFPEAGIDAYFGTWGHRLRLFDPERPWMQDPRLATECDPARSAGVNKLVVTRPSGNNHSWFTHVQDAVPDPVPAGEAALNLLTWHYYGPAGQGSSRTVGSKTSASMKAGSLRGALSYHPEGVTLFETLLAGLLRPDHTVRREADLCAWERDALPDPDGEPPVVNGPCGRLTGTSQHALLLVPNPADPGSAKDAFITWAYRDGRAVRDDPYLIWQISPQGNPRPRLAQAGRALWRDLDALLLTNADGPARVRQPEIFSYEQALELSDALDRPLAVRSLGFDQVRAKDRQFVAGLTPAILDTAERKNARTATAVGRMCGYGELYGRRLDRAVRRACQLYTGEPAPKQAEAWAERAAALYWPQAEQEFWDLFGTLDREGRRHEVDAGLDRKAARGAFLKLATRAFEEITDPVCHTQRGAKAVGRARIELYGGPGKPLPRPRTPQQDQPIAQEEQPA
ncbi:MULTISPECIES: type I-E CRISPR-associated protein Cse1/CasA [Streptomyces]|uniref:Type I-E CRISPR-associated protein Cse1/CasA n=1 Tax=Streptomyces evansiae TaxID=3075535 RepID=A0ABU2QTI0_9ACTN|nr:MULTISPECIES: type I-E CRISPR-associated protein Cse1/CasA [unclassified Streptomyces]MDT0407739.1 type I-E CRISPR-associated protein Cse1/CasA [Streptomyces sp. DSM 41979]MYQ61469.1 type I-E CRISPR-associated protein Cse1/CasA [Streptomyces sp. SID4926]SCE58926.1 CRISPR-associated protein, Cse1 family [Streptomyces sp. DfronAA-171]